MLTLYRYTTAFLYSLLMRDSHWVWHSLFVASVEISFLISEVTACLWYLCQHLNRQFALLMTMPLASYFETAFFISKVWLHEDNNSNDSVLTRWFHALKLLLKMTQKVDHPFIYYTIKHVNIIIDTWQV